MKAQELVGYCLLAAASFIVYFNFTSAESTLERPVWCQTHSEKVNSRQNAIKLKLSYRIDAERNIPSYNMTRWDLARFHRYSTALYMMPDGKYSHLFNYWPNEENTTAPTVVVSLWNLKIPHRPIESYQDWLVTILNIKAPLVIYIDKHLAKFVKKHRPLGLSTVLITPDIQDLPFYEFHERIKTVQNDEKYFGKIKDAIERPECSQSLLAVFQASKLEILSDAAHLNPFGSQIFIWMDPGITRFFDGVDLKTPWIGSHFALDKFNVQAYTAIKGYKFDPEIVKWGSDKKMPSGVLGGGKRAIDKIASRFRNLFINLLDNGLVNSEQILLHLLLMEDKSDFNVFCREGGPFALGKFMEYASTPPGEGDFSQDLCNNEILQ